MRENNSESLDYSRETEELLLTVIICLQIGETRSMFSKNLLSFEVIADVRFFSKTLITTKLLKLQNRP